MCDHLINTLTIILLFMVANTMFSVGWGIAWRIFFSRFALVRELFGLNESDSKKSAAVKREFSNRHVPRNGLRQRRTKETSTLTPIKSYEQGTDGGSSTEPLIVDESQPVAATSTLNSEEIEEFFSITNTYTDVKDVKKPKNAVLETFDPLNS